MGLGKRIKKRPIVAGVAAGVIANKITSKNNKQPQNTTVIIYDNEPLMI